MELLPIRRYATEIARRFLNRTATFRVTKPETIAKAAQTIQTRYGRLDILVNNAGVADNGDGPPSTADPEAVRRVPDVNFFGVLAVTQAMLPLVRNSAAGRIVMISS